MKHILRNIVVWILILEARIVLRKYKPKIVGVTGSVGKTSTKDAIFTVLGSRFYVRKSQKSFNSDIGIPLTILGCDTAWSNPFLWLKNIGIGLGVILFPNHYPEWLVLEVGLDRPGDIRRAIQWLRFDVVVYTRLSEKPVHVEFFESPEELLKEKAMLASGLRKGGVLVLNADDPLQTYRRDDTTMFTYGLERALVSGSHITVEYEHGAPSGMSFRVDYAGSSVPMVTQGVLGEQHIYPALAAFAVGLSLDIHLVHMEKAYHKHKYMPGRMRILEGIRNSTIIDDSYNASPIATETALSVLRRLESTGRKICVLGDMTELGDLTIESHEHVGKQAAETVDIFIAVGSRMSVAAETARLSGMQTERVKNFLSSKEAGEYVKTILQEKDIILVKGSQSMRMEHVVKILLRRQEKSKKLLVRQEALWLKQ